MQATRQMRRVGIEPWYVTYALLGATMAGIAPIVLPLAVSRSGSIAAVGLVMAAFNLGGLTAPLWGALADRYRLHRALMLVGLLATAIALAGFPLALSLGAWLILALVQGAGAAAAATVANLFIVQVHPRAEWDERIGWLQTFYGGGQVVGLLLAGALGQTSLRLGLWTAAGLTALALLPAWLTPRLAGPGAPPRPVVVHPAGQAHWSAGSPQHSYHWPGMGAVRQVARSLDSPFVVFLAGWLLSFAGAAAVFSLYPVVMQELFGVTPGASSAGFAVAAALGLALYAPTGRWSNQLGSLRVLQTGLGVRVLAFIGLFALGMSHFGNQGALASIGFLFVVLAWSLLSVTGTALAAQLSPVGEGEGLGLFNATTAVAGVVGAVLGGWLSQVWGYNAAAGLGVAGVTLGLLLSIALRPSRQKSQSLPPQ